jgi:hypothetical protein
MYNFTVLAVFYSESSAGPPRLKVGFVLPTMGFVFVVEGVRGGEARLRYYIYVYPFYFSGVPS